jgi:hypothetical protein
LTSYIDTVVPKNVFLFHCLATPLEATGKIMNRIRDPLRADLNKGKPCVGKFSRYFVE